MREGYTDFHAEKAPQDIFATHRRTTKFGGRSEKRRSRLPRTAWPDTGRWAATRRRNTNPVGTRQTSSVDRHSAGYFCIVRSPKHFSYSSRQSNREKNSEIRQVVRNTLVLPCGNRDGRTMERTSDGTYTRNRKKIDHRHVRSFGNVISFPAYFHNHPDRQCGGFPEHFPYREIVLRIHLVNIFKELIVYFLD